ncbi:hypothetical protein [Synechococcus sp. CBW1108]|uniref:hypothetical protein n=1 Tax=Synechococcus sp. CBW1108 TaxID=1353147 RepID=UPI00351C0409
MAQALRVLCLEGLHDELRPGRPRTYDDDQMAEVINRALQTRPPDGSTHWSARYLAAGFSLQPHRQKHHRCIEDVSIDVNPPLAFRFADAERMQRPALNPPLDYPARSAHREPGP